MENNINQIVQIDNTDKQKSVYNHTKETIDFMTGEIVSQEQLHISKETKKDNFIKIFIENLCFLASSLNNSEKTILFYIMANMNYQNVIHISSDLRKLIEKKASISRTTIFTALNGLKEKNVLIVPVDDKIKEEYNIYSKNSFILNPNVIGKGSFNDLKKLRQTVITNFDFDKLEATQEVIRQIKDDDFEEVKQDIINGKSEIKHISQSYDEKNNIQKTDIMIADKEENKGDYSIITVNPIKENEQEKNIIEYEKDQQETRREKMQFDLEMKNAAIREQEALNRAKELSIEDKKLEIELLKLKGKENKQNSLFGDEL